MCGNAPWHISGKNWSHSLENRHLACCLWMIVVRPGQPHMQSCRMTLLLCFPCWCSAPVPGLLPASNHLPYRESSKSAPVLRQLLTWARGTMFTGVWEGWGPLSLLELPLPDSCRDRSPLGLSCYCCHFRTLFSSLLPIPCSGELSCCLTGMFWCPVLNLGTFYKQYVTFLRLPFEEAIAGAFWSLSAFLGIGKRESWCLYVVWSLCAQWLWQPLVSFKANQKLNYFMLSKSKMILLWWTDGK